MICGIVNTLKTRRSRCIFCIAIKEMEAWLLGDIKAIIKAYPDAKIQYIKKYKQDAVCRTWEVLSDSIYPQGLSNLRKRAGGSYSEIGKAKCEWADKIGRCLHLHENASPSYQYFIGELEKRIHLPPSPKAVSSAKTVTSG